MVPVLLLDPGGRERLARSPRRASYFCGAVRSLAQGLERSGSALTVRHGMQASSVRRLLRETRAEAVIWSWSYDAAGLARDRALQSVVEEAGARAIIVHDAPAVAPELTAEVRASAAGAGYRAFPPFYAAWRRTPPEPAAGPSPTFARTTLASEPLPQPVDFAASACEREAGEPVAARALDAFVDGPLLRYAQGRTAPALDGTARFAAHLSFGTLCARAVCRELAERAADPFLLSEERMSLELFTRAIARRDFFLQLAWFYEDRPDAPLQARMRGFPFARSHPLIDRWHDGTTGVPLVDAGMRELKATGWMHPQVRFVAASFLCFDLGVDWRVGREAWDRELIEDEAALATGNWQYVAGVGADLAQYPRIYNPYVQARRFDPDGTYVSRWLPELTSRANSAREDPRQTSLALFGAQTYPPPIVEHRAAARAFLDRYRGWMRTQSTRR